LTPYAWRKLLFLRDLGPTEVGGFGISAANDLLLIEDICLIAQRCSPFTVAFEDEAVADFFDERVDRGYQVEQFARIWLHTHPGSSASPSGTDEATFARCFGRSDWAIMFILARGGESYARLGLSGGPGAELLLPVEIDFSRPFPSSDEAAWEQEYLAAVREERRYQPFTEERLLVSAAGSPLDLDTRLTEWLDDPFAYSQGLEVAGERF